MWGDTISLDIQDIQINEGLLSINFTITCIVHQTFGEYGQSLHNAERWLMECRINDVQLVFSVLKGTITICVQMQEDWN